MLEGGGGWGAMPFGVRGLLGRWTDGLETQPCEDDGRCVEARFEFHGEVSNWGVTQVESMSHMFRGGQNFNRPLQAWTTGKVKDMSMMFRGYAKFDRPITS